MKNIFWIIISIFICKYGIINAQKSMDYTREELEAKNKDELVQIAKNLLKERHPEIVLNLNNFDIRVWSNDFGITEVIFRRAIRYASNESKDLHYDITINLNTKEIIPFDNPDMKFYASSIKAEKAIKALRDKGLLPKNNKPDTEYTITENAEYYLISCFYAVLHGEERSLLLNDGKHSYLSKTILNKKTGEILFFKGENPFYYTTQRTFEHYYKEYLYTILKEKNVSSKTRIIEIASAILKEKQPNLQLNTDDFEIIILGNYKDIIVKYRRFVRFNKNDQKTVFDLAVNIITKEIFPFEFSETSFYIPSSSDLDVISTIQKIVPLKRSPGIEYTFSENENFYSVVSISEKTTKKLLIEKKNIEIVWMDESNTLQMNNREDLSLKEHYKRTNGFFGIKPENQKPLLNIALTVLNDRKFIPNINPDDYRITYTASKNEIKVDLKRLVRFIPLRHKDKAKYNYNLEVSLVNKTVAQNPKHFYFPTQKDSIYIELVKTKLIEYLEGKEEIIYPLEIIEEKDFYKIDILGNLDYRKGHRKQYHLDKKTKTIEVISIPTYFYPTPAMPPVPFREKND